MSHIFQLIWMEFTKLGIKVWTRNDEIEFWRSIIFRYQYKFRGSSYIDVIDMPLLCKQKQTMVFSKEDKVFIKVLHQERVMEQNSLSKSLQTKSGLCHLWRSCCQRLIKWYCGSQNDSLKQIRTSLSCHTVTGKISRMFTQFHSYGFQMINFYFCSANEHPEWSQNCCVVNCTLSVMYFKC